MKILLVDDHPIFRGGVELLLKNLDPSIEVLHAANCAEGISIALQQTLNLVFLDLELPDGSGLKVLEDMKNARPSLPVVVLSGSEDRSAIERAIDLKAMGFVPKSENTDMLFAAFRSALAGGVFLPANFLNKVGYGSSSQDKRICKDIESGIPTPHTPNEIGITKRQLDVLGLLVQGMPNKRIATNLDISVQVVKKHVSDLLAHFKVMSRTQLVIQIAQRGLVFGPPSESNPIDEVT
ncbi:MAG: response regulator transcription factor [Bacteroidales bacterium]|nr:response regulator transcription factor [Bacteroidales bacterium]